jgi:hypothetical protein
MAKEFTGVSFQGVVTLIWKSFSEHVHGNHLFNLPQGNEVLWINLQNIVLLTNIIEVVDSQILQKERAADTRVRFQETQKIGMDLINAWEKKSLEE